MKKILSICTGVLLSAIATWCTAAAAEKIDKNQFVSVKGTQFILNGKSYMVAGTNMWYGGYLGSAGKVGNRDRLKKELDNLQAMGINNIRVLAVSERSETNSAVRPATTNGFGNYDEELLAGLDYLLAEMAKRDMTAVLYLNNFWQWSGGMTQYMSWIDGQPVQDPNVTKDYETFMAKSASFYTSKKAQQEYQRTIKKLVTRVNTVTGKAYVTDPTIFSWQLANEPRAGASKTDDKSKAIYVKWIEDTAKYIHSLDANHMVSTGSEGLMGSNVDEALYLNAHASKYVDYLTYHLWIRNWGWFDQHKPTETWPAGLAKAKEYLNVHVDFAKKANKPIVLEEFGLDRDMGAYDVKSTTQIRDRYYKEVFDLLYQRAKSGDPIAGWNFWAWNGAARTARPNYWWQAGDDYMGDPPQEEQGMYGVFDSDVTTILLIKDYADKMRALAK